MTKKTKLTKQHRELIERFGVTHITGGIDRVRELAQLAILLAGANKTIRQKYPEADMAILRKYKLERIDRCLKFQFPSGRVDGFTFPHDTAVADVPYTRGCSYGTSDVFAVSAGAESAFDAHAKLKAENDKQQHHRISEFRGFLEACRYVEDVLDVIPLPDDLRKRLGHTSTALVAVTPETVKSLKAAFEKAGGSEVAA